MRYKKRTEEEWVAFDEIARDYYKDGQENLLPAPSQTYERKATNGIVVRLGKYLYDWRREGRKIPGDMPKDLKDFLEVCGAIGVPAKAVASRAVKFSSDARWEAFGEIAREYYGDGQENLRTVPPQTYERKATNGIMVHLGHDLHNWLREGRRIPGDMPKDLKDFLEDCGAIGDVAKAAAKSSSDARWEAFGEIAREYYGDRQRNLLTVPSQTYEREATNGIMVHLGKDLHNWRREGRQIPGDMPQYLRDFLEGCGAIGVLAKAVAPSAVKFSSDARWEAFGEIAREYYGDRQKNLLTVPPQTYERQATNGIMVHLGQNLHDWRREGRTVPKSMPKDLKNFLEGCGAIDVLAKAVVPTRRRGRRGGDKGREVSARVSEAAGVVSGDYGERAPEVLGYSAGYGGPYGGAGWEWFPQGVMGSVQQSAGGEYSYGGAYSSGYGGQVPDRVGTPPGHERRYAGTEWESFGPVGGSAARLITGAGGASPADGYVVPAGSAQGSAVGAYSYGGYTATRDYQDRVYSGGYGG
ncbi:hypothetical protein ACLQ25_32530, partial [Micromonospora sp. DT44]